MGKRIIALVLTLGVALALAPSCKKDGLYIQLPNTVWQYGSGHQMAHICFCGEEYASVMQLDLNTGYQSDNHGRYTTDGHNVDIEGTSNVHMVRTFSHLKHSTTNKNLTPLEPQSYSSLKGSVWTTIWDGNLYFAFFRSENSCIQALYKNIVRKEGYEYGWEWSQLNYALSGNIVSAGGQQGALYNGGIMRLPHHAVQCTTVPREAGASQSPLTGSVWILSNSGTPGLWIFDGDGTFTRVLVLSGSVWENKWGTYSLEGDQLTIQMNEHKETCPLEQDRFTFLGKSYTRVQL